MKINLSPRFKRSYKKLPPRIQNDFDEKIILFANDEVDLLNVGSHDQYKQWGK